MVPLLSVCTDNVPDTLATWILFFCTLSACLYMFLFARFKTTDVHRELRHPQHLEYSFAAKANWRYRHCKLTEKSMNIMIAPHSKDTIMMQSHATTVLKMATKKSKIYLAAKYKSFCCLTFRDMSSALTVKSLSEPTELACILAADDKFITNNRTANVEPTTYKCD